MKKVGRDAGNWKRRFLGAQKQRMKASMVIFCTSSIGGLLTNKMKENEIEMSQLTKFRIMFQKAGDAEQMMLFSTDLASREHYGRKGCQPCMYE